jgi:signal transduction histidine kinase
MSRDLHPSILEDLGLVRAIQSECRDFSSRSGIAVVFTPDNVPDNIPNDISLNIYRIIQEALSNIVKYAKTKNAYVFLEGSDHQLTLSVRDTGVGFDPSEVKHKTALGLSSMRERARLANGTFSITSKPRKGTIIKVIVPLEKQ